jgi:hypothetical protein
MLLQLYATYCVYNIVLLCIYAHYVHVHDVYTYLLRRSDMRQLYVVAWSTSLHSKISHLHIFILIIFLKVNVIGKLY